MRVVLAILMFATMIQVAQADDVDGASATVIRCITADDGTTTCTSD